MNKRARSSYTCNVAQSLFGNDAPDGFVPVDQSGATRHFQVLSVGDKRVQLSFGGRTHAFTALVTISQEPVPEEHWGG